MSAQIYATRNILDESVDARNSTSDNVIYYIRDKQYPMQMLQRPKLLRMRRLFCFLAVAAVLLHLMRMNVCRINKANSLSELARATCRLAQIAGY